MTFVLSTRYRFQGLLSEMIMEIEKKIGELLMAKGLLMGTAESCTGGNISAMITSIPGSSAYFNGAVVSYSNEVKHKVLGVSETDLEQYGAVSCSVVGQMAVGAIRVLNCDCAVATSGIAGPGGGTAQKPVGTVWIAAAVGDNVFTSLNHFDGERKEIIQKASEKALEILFELISGK